MPPSKKDPVLGIDPSGAAYRFDAMKVAAGWAEPLSRIEDIRKLPGVTVVPSAWRQVLALRAATPTDHIPSSPVLRQPSRAPSQTARQSSCRVLQFAEYRRLRNG